MVDMQYKTRVTVSEISQRHNSYKWYLPHLGLRKEVCKGFFLTTLGLQQGNDSSVRNALTHTMNAVPGKDMQGKHAPSKKLDERYYIRVRIKIIRD